MFENTPSQPMQKAGEPKDMYAEVDDAAKPQEPQESFLPQNIGQEEDTHQSFFSLRNILLIVGGLIGLGVIGMGAFLYMQSLKKPVLAPQYDTQAQTAPIAQPVPVVPEQPPIVQPLQQAPVVQTDPRLLDTDGDGLSDYDEMNTYRTDPKNVDTDGDGLSDREEVLIYKSNPVIPDTDGDGYPDGLEVSKGYDPNGPGKLKVLPQPPTPAPGASTAPQTAPTASPGPGASPQGNERAPLAPSAETK